MKLEATYDLDETDYVQNPYEMHPVIGSGSDYWIFVLDVNPEVDTLEKEGDVKIFSIKDGQFDLSQTITSEDFGVKPRQPINGMDIYDVNKWFVTIGGSGIGGVLFDG